MNTFKKYKSFGKGKVLIDNELKEIKCASWSLNVLPDVNEKLFAGGGKEIIEFKGKFVPEKIKGIRMRMWMLNPKYLCQKHLLGEHNELHKFKPSFEKKYSIKGRIYPIVQIEPLSMKIRHDDLAQEMIKRGYNHKSPYEMPDLSYLTKKEREAKVYILRSIEDLWDRCPDCRELLNEKIIEFLYKDPILEPTEIEKIIEKFETEAD